MFWVRVANTQDYCLMWGNNSPRWEGSRAAAEDRARKLTATSYNRTVYEAVPVDEAAQ